MPRESKSPPENNWISREDLQDIAKIGGDLLKRTVSSSIDVIKDVTDTLPKDASQLISKSREEVMKGLSREFAQNLVSLAVDKVFAAVRDHRLDISIRVRKSSDPNPGEAQKSPSRGESNAHNEGQSSVSRSAHHDGRASHERHPPSEQNSLTKKGFQNRHRP